MSGLLQLGWRSRDQLLANSGLAARAEWDRYKEMADKYKAEGDVKMELYYCKLLADCLVLAAPRVGPDGQEEELVQFMAEAKATWKEATYWVHRWVKREMEQKGRDNPVVRRPEFHKMRENLVVACSFQSVLSRFDEVIKTADLFLEVKPAEVTMEELRVQLMKGVARYFLGLAAAVYEFDVAVGLAQKLNCTELEAVAWYGKSMALKRTDDRHLCEEEIVECFSRYEQLTSGVTSDDRAHVERLFVIHPTRYEHLEEIKKPEKEIQRLEAELVGEKSPIRLASAHLTLGHWYVQQKEFPKAEENLRQAIKHGVRITPAVMNSDSVYQTTARILLLAPAFQLLQLCLAQQGKTVEALMWAERARARTMRFGLVNRPPESDDAAGYIDEFEEDDNLAQEKILGALSGCKLAGSVVAVEYSFVQSNLLIWVLKPKLHPTVHQVISDLKDIDFPCNLDGNQASLKAMASVEALLKQIINKRSCDKGLSFFHKLLIEPIKEELTGCDTIVFIPVQTLHRLPWSALIDQHQKDGEKYLIQRHAVAVAPSLIALSACSENLEQKMAKKDLNHEEILVIANPWPLSIPKMSFLSEALAEAAAIVKLVKAYTGLVPRVFKGEAATRETVMENLPRAKWVHFACHNIVNDDEYNAGALLLAQPFMNHIVGAMCLNVSWNLPPKGTKSTQLANGRVLRTGTNLGSIVGQPMDETTSNNEIMRGLLSAQQLTHCKLQAAYGVVLSACSTAEGVLIGDEGIFGMARASLVAGAPAVVLSLWKVEEVATRNHTTQMYKNLITGRDPNTGRPYNLAFAHRQGTLSMIGKGYQVRDWAAFQVFGTPDVVFPGVDLSDHSSYKGFGRWLQKPGNAIILIPLVTVFCGILVAILLSRLGRSVVGEAS